MAHVGEEARFQLAGLAQLLGPLVEFGIQRDDAAIGVLQFGVELLQFLLPQAQFRQAGDQFGVLGLQLLHRVGLLAEVQRVRDADDIRRRDAGALRQAA